MRQLVPLKPGDLQISSDDINAVFMELMRCGKIWVDGGDIISEGGGMLIRPGQQQDWFWARLTGSSGAKYSWVESYRVAQDTFIDLPNGRSGTTAKSAARERNAATGIANNTIVRMYEGFGLPSATSGGTVDQEYIFEGGGGETDPLTTKGDIEVFSTVVTRLPVGSDFQKLMANSAQTTGLAWQTGYMITGRQVLHPGTVTYTPTAGTNAILVQCTAAGGGSGGALSISGGGAVSGSGGGGSFSEAFIVGPLSVSYGVVIGSGGGAGAATPSDGGTGGATTFNVTTVITNGGLGGKQANNGGTGAFTAVGGAGGAPGSAGDVLLAGNAGGCGISINVNINASMPGGDGAGPHGGGAGTPVTGSSSTSGNAGRNYGGGASGSISTNAVGKAGLVGGDGVMVIWEFA